MEKEKEKNDMKHMMTLRTELGQIFSLESRLLHHQRRAIKSMIVCEQLAIATQACNYGEEHFSFRF